MKSGEIMIKSLSFMSFVITLCLLLTSCVNSNNIELDESKTTQSDTILSDIQYTELKDKNDILAFDDGKYFVYFTKKDCPYCEEINPLINEYISSDESLKMYFVDKDSCLDLNIFTDTTDSVDGYTLPGAPSMILVDNGQIYRISSGGQNIANLLKQEG